MTVQRSWRRIRGRLEQLRRDRGLSRTAVAANGGCSRHIIDAIEAGRRYCRIDGVIGYIQGLGDVELIIAGRHVARLAELEDGEVVLLLRAATAASQGHRLNPVESMRVRRILERLSPRSG